MATPSRFTKVGLQGRTGVPANTLDSFLQTVEFPVVAVASAAAQDTGIKTPTKGMQVVSSYMVIKTLESTAAAPTVDVGITSNGAAIQNDTDVSNAIIAGTPVTQAIQTTASTNFTYTLAGADFAELDAVCVVTFVGIDI